MDETNNNLLETVGHLQQTDQLTSRFLATMAAELRTWDSMFDLMKLETGGFELDIQEVDFKQLVERVIIIVSDYTKTIYGEPEKARPRMVKPEIGYIIPEELPCLQLDTLRVERLLTELLLAAVQVRRSRRGRVKFSVEWVQDWLVIEISDNGVGLPKHLINYRPNIPSIGAVVVERHGGKLEITHQAKGGWAVTLKFPVSPPTAQV